MNLYPLPNHPMEYILNLLPLWSTCEKGGETTKEGVCVTRSRLLCCDSTHPDAQCDGSGVFYLTCSRDGRLTPQVHCARHWYELHLGHGGWRRIEDMAGDEFDEQLRAFRGWQRSETDDIAAGLRDAAFRLAWAGSHEMSDSLLRLIASIERREWPL